MHRLLYKKTFYLLTNMKKITYYLTLFVAAASLALGGCKKSSSSDTDTTPKVYNAGVAVNSNTAHLIANYDFADTALTNHGWKKTFEDNFDGDLSKWHVLQGGVKGELQCYEPQNATTANGILQIAARRETVTGPPVVDSAGSKSFNFTSAWLVSKNSISACTSTPRIRVVVRMKTIASYGLTTVLCTYGENWPVNGEIVCAEVTDSDRKKYGTSYSFGSSAGSDLVQKAYQFNPTDGDLSADYHVYTMEWSQSALTYYIDGNLVEVKTAGNHVPNLFDKYQRLSINVPVGGRYYPGLKESDVTDGNMYVDYVKVFTSN